MDVTDKLIRLIVHAIITLEVGGSESHDAAVCEDRLREALMWAERVKREES